MVYIIDNIPTDITEMPLDPQEIESVNSNKRHCWKSNVWTSGCKRYYLIKTKRGKTNERVMNVT